MAFRIRWAAGLVCQRTHYVVSTAYRWCTRMVHSVPLTEQCPPVLALECYQGCYQGWNIYRQGRSVKLFHSLLRYYSNLLPSIMFFPTVAITCSLFGAAVSQFVSPPQNLTTAMGYAGFKVRYQQVPSGICEQRADLKSYA